MGRKYIDLTGQNINGIIVTKLIENSGGQGKHKKWDCICPMCKQHFVVSSQHLRGTDAITKCSECSRKQYKDLSGQRFGKLTVLKRDFSTATQRISYLCECDCGSIVSVQANHLVAGETISCGCARSSNEEKISQFLKENDIIFEREKTFEKCNFLSPLRFDFYLPEYNLVIEYQGIQHYEPVEYFGGKKDFEIRQKRDAIKKEFCLNNNIKYIEIKYNEPLFPVLTQIINNEEIVCPYGNIVG